MYGSIRLMWRARRSRARLLVAAALVSGVLVVAGSTSSVAALRSCGPVTVCYDPQQFRAAYGIQPLLDSGIDGRGVTVTILTIAPPASAPAPDATDIRRDLAKFDSVFGLAAARISVVTSLAGSASPWRADLEEVQDLEIVHAVAPAANLRVVLMPSSVRESAASAIANVLPGLRLAVSHTDVASVSWSLGEHYFTPAQAAAMHSILLGAVAHHVTVIASSGDFGADSDVRFGSKPVKEVSLPASDPLVLAVGGTTLTAKRSTGAYGGEIAWSGSGGGFSHLYARPTYQDGVPGIAKARGVPDVAGDANPHGGFMLAVTVGRAGFVMTPASGTSASTPLWGGLVALADQYAHHGVGFANPTIYRIARSSSYDKAFHDVVHGSSRGTVPSVPAPVTVPGAGYQAVRGWEPVTGWGTPNAHVLIPLLARSSAPSKTEKKSGRAFPPPRPGRPAAPSKLNTRVRAP